MRPIMFLLPVKGGGGGAHSVMQEANTMCSMGYPALIACNTGNVSVLSANYQDMIYIKDRIFGYENIESLVHLIREKSPSICVATTNQSVHVLAAALKGGAGVRAAYYVQDYEPLFYNPDSDDWQLAYSSYGLIPNMVHFAKTKWIQEVVLENHGIIVSKVSPSIDHSLYRPNFSALHALCDSKAGLGIVAMLRPSTPRRAPVRTARILNELCVRYGTKVQIKVFGCRQSDIDNANLELNSSIECLGILGRSDIAELFRSSDLFLDLSDFQAFGRSAIEAMACGVICVVPAHGGAHEYAVDGVNSFIVDTRHDDAIFRTVESCLVMAPSDKIAMRLSAIKRSFEYNLECSALSEISVLCG